VGNRGTTRGPRPQSPTRRPLVHRCAQAFHRLSTGFAPNPVHNVETLPTRRPQNLQQEIHRRPQPVGSFVTVCVCPHRFPQAPSTSVQNPGGELSTAGDKPWGRTVDNNGTPGTAESVSGRGLAGPRPQSRGTRGRRVLPSRRRGCPAIRPRPVVGARAGPSDPGESAAQDSRQVLAGQAAGERIRLRVGIRAGRAGRCERWPMQALCGVGLARGGCRSSRGRVVPEDGHSGVGFARRRRLLAGVHGHAPPFRRGVCPAGGPQLAREHGHGGRHTGVSNTRGAMPVVRRGSGLRPFRWDAGGCRYPILSCS
jgi:hypothetical protein